MIGVVAIITCTDFFTTSFTFRRQNEKLTLRPEQSERMITSSFLNRLDSDIKRLEDSNSKLSTISTQSTKEKRHARYMTIKNHRTSLFTIMGNPTNTRRVYLKSKTGPYLKMSKNGVLGGTSNMKDPEGK